MLDLQRAIDSRIWIVCAYLLWFCIVCSGMSYLQISPNNRLFFGPENSRFNELLKFEAEFGSNTSLVIALTKKAVESPDSELADATKWLHAQSWNIPYVSRVDSLANYPRLISDGDSFETSNLLEYVCPGGSSCDFHEGDVLKLTHLVGRYVSEDLNTLAVVSRVNIDSQSASEVAEIDNAVRVLLVELESRYQGIEAHYTGGVPMMQAFAEAASVDTSKLLVLSLIVILVVTFLFLRSVLVTLLLVGLSFSSALLTLGFAGWFGVVINTATSMVPLVVITLVTASSMHFVLGVLHVSQTTDGEITSQVIAQAVNSNWRPLVLTTATSQIGLLSMTFVSAPPLQELGVWSSVGLLIGTILSLTILPVLFSFFGKLNKRDASAPLGGISRLMEANRFSSKSVFGGAIAIMIIGLAGINQLVVDEDFVRYFPEDARFRLDTEAITARLSGPYHIEIAMDFGQDESVFLDRSLSFQNQIVDELRSLSIVSNVFWIGDLLREVHEQIEPNGSYETLIAEQRAQYFLAYELSQAMGQSSTDIVNASRSKGRISVLLRDCSMVEIRELEDSLEGFVGQLAFSDEFEVSITGEGIPTAYLSHDNIREMSLGILLSLVLITGLVSFVLRDSKIGLVVLAATILPVACGFGLWGYIFGSVGLAGTLVIAVTIGVVIDDVVHFVYRYKEGIRQEGLSIDSSVDYAIQRVGPAIVVTSLVLAAGFSILVFSGFRLNSAFGSCVALVVILALGYNLIVTPRLICFLYRSNSFQLSA